MNPINPDYIIIFLATYGLVGMVQGFLWFRSKWIYSSISDLIECLIAGMIIGAPEMVCVTIKRLCKMIPVRERGTSLKYKYAYRNDKFGRTMDKILRKQTRKPE